MTRLTLTLTIEQKLPLNRAAAGPFQLQGMEPGLSHMVDLAECRPGQAARQGQKDDPHTLQSRLSQSSTTASTLNDSSIEGSHGQAFEMNCERRDEEGMSRQVCLTRRNLSQNRLRWC